MATLVTNSQFIIKELCGSYAVTNKKILTKSELYNEGPGFCIMFCQYRYHALSTRGLDEESAKVIVYKNSEPYNINCYFGSEEAVLDHLYHKQCNESELVCCYVRNPIPVQFTSEERRVLEANNLPIANLLTEKSIKTEPAKADLPAEPAKLHISAELTADQYRKLILAIPDEILMLIVNHESA